MMNYVSEEINEAAKFANIDEYGVTDILDLAYLKNYLIDRNAKGYGNEFEESDINKRLNINKVFPNCKSIIAAIFPYAEGYNKITTTNKGLISVSSYGDDYHKMVKSKLNSFAKKLNEHVNFEYNICVDTSPLIDKAICKNAGLGNYGKNSLLINETYGSFVFLGYILTDIVIEPNIKHNGIQDLLENKDICGSCNICVKSCPNNAILDKGLINTKKCISYLTQTKNYIPIESRKSMKNQIYGCDICQIVCPKNKRRTFETKHNYDYSELEIDLEELLDMSNVMFTQKYGHVAGSWRGKNIWKRNAIISVANLGMNNLFDKIKGELDNPIDLVKIYAAWALITLNRITGSEIILRQLKYEKNPIKNEYIRLLEEIGR